MIWSCPARSATQMIDCSTRLLPEKSNSSKVYICRREVSMMSLKATALLHSTWCHLEEILCVGYGIHQVCQTVLCLSCHASLFLYASTIYLCSRGSASSNCVYVYTCVCVCVCAHVLVGGCGCGCVCVREAFTLSWGNQIYIKCKEFLFKVSHYLKTKVKIP